jgi:N-acetylmuramoyl-L-alanine amidase
VAGEGHCPAVTEQISAVQLDLQELSSKDALPMKFEVFKKYSSLRLLPILTKAAACLLTLVWYSYADYVEVRSNGRLLCALYDISADSPQTINLSEAAPCIGATETDKDGEILVQHNRIKVFAETAYLHVNRTKYHLSQATKKKGTTFYVSKEFLSTLYPLLTDKPITLETIATAKPKALKCIAIDPGHGGQDFGARSHMYVDAVEKKFTLDIALSLLPLLGKKMGARIMLTRYRDQFISLYDRVELANRNTCDLLLSVHINASKEEGVGGMETYFLSLEAIDKYTQEIARLENQHIRYFNDIPGSVDQKVQTILHDLAVKDFIMDSSRLAELVQTKLTAQTTLSDRGIRQAPLYILSRVQMPSILLELGFISNRADTDFLKKEPNLDRIGSAVLQSLQVFEGILAQKRGVSG